MQAQLTIFSSDKALVEAVASRMIQLIQQAHAEQRQCNIALSGGSTPKRLYEYLRQRAHNNDIPWEHAHFFLGDERYVPNDHPDSNYALAQRYLFDDLLQHKNKVAIEAVATHLSPQQAAQDYSQRLSCLPQKNHLPVFDLILLGIGEDGHTASLFPDTNALKETEHGFVANYVDKLKCWRLSISIPVINQAKQIIILACGASKQTILKQVLDEAKTDPQYPVNHIQAQGQFECFADKEAARLIDGK
ncbi:MAG: 6-phosphogluconolactonase [Gammaproteobacteria bacterium]|nr:6-phosphogluconolactonase [Gammaproteobacteria bacterium]MDH5728736.1 6-phosphogluconolactonase [Gammaproteobacteria bacterium]